MASALYAVAYRLFTSILSFFLIVPFLVTLAAANVAISRHIPAPYTQPAMIVVSAGTTGFASSLFWRWRKRRRAWSQTAGILRKAADTTLSLADRARANIARLNLSGDMTNLAKLDCQTIGAALRRDIPGDTRYLLIYAVALNARARPASLDLQWPLHTSCTFADALLSFPGPKPPHEYIAERYRGIVVHSSLLAELLRHTARTYETGAEGLATRLAIQSKDPAADRKLRRLATRHADEIERLASALAEEFPESKTVTDLLATFKPVSFPVLTVFKDHPGATTLNSVWFPREHAEPLMKWVTQQQAMAMGQGAIPGRPDAAN